LKRSSSDPTLDREPPAAWRVEVFRRDAVGDPEGERALAGMAELGVRGIRRARLGRGYLLSPELPREALERIASELLVDPVLEEARISAPREAPGGAPEGTWRPDHRVLAMRRPGVVDPVAVTVERTIARTELAPASGQGGSSSPVRVLTFRAWELAGEATAAELTELASKLFANDVIDEVFVDDEALHFELPASRASTDSPRVPLRAVDDAELERVSREGGLSLTLEEMQAIQAHSRELDRAPTACELETLAPTWSEHCKHTTFAGRVDFDGERIENLFKETIVAATRELESSRTGVFRALCTRITWRWVMRLGRIHGRIQMSLPRCPQPSWNLSSTRARWKLALNWECRCSVRRYRVIRKT
jgi:phosphoribosylformylglycinamidine synthase